MKSFYFRGKNPELIKKVEQVMEETIIHRWPFMVQHGKWPFVVFGPYSKEGSIVRVGLAEQTIIKKVPVYIATLGGEHIPDFEGMPVEELAGGDIPDEIAGLKVFHLSPLRPISIANKKSGPPVVKAVDEILELYNDKVTAVIETPDESYWILSILKYLDESDQLSLDPVMNDFFSHMKRNHGPSRFGYGPFYKH